MNGGEDRLNSAIENLERAVNEKLLTSSASRNIQTWLKSSAFHSYHDRLYAMVEAKDWKQLDLLFWEVIPFGTGGRRGTMGELGTATINPRTIAESAHGLAVYLKKQKPQASGEQFAGRAVVTHDSRNNSPEFARLTATTFAANGLKVFLFDGERSTPELSFAVRHLNCDTGVMISASHNPPSDNGFKAYWSEGAQVLPPHDQRIIECVYQTEEIPELDFEDARQRGLIEIVGREVDDLYLAEVVSLSLSSERDFKAVFTPLHGVGATSVYKVLQRAGFEGVEILESQKEPDGNFPTVPENFPNPERPQVFDLAKQRAREIGATVVLASDPDADRLGLCVQRADGEFETLSGNQIGCLLVDYILQKRKDLSPEHYIVETLVTTGLIAAIGKAHNVRVIDDLLVGFKYIAQVMDAEGPDRFIFGAEESLGYLAGQYCRDKDAAVAALYIMEAAAEYRKQGKTLLDRLNELYVQHDYHEEGQVSKVCEGPTGSQQIQLILDTFRRNPPAELAGYSLARVRDYETHELRELPGNRVAGTIEKPTGNLLFFDSKRGADGFQFRFAVRPSGTEPKIKFYFFAQGACGSPEELPRVKEQTKQNMKEVQHSLVKWISSVVDAD